MYLVTFILAGLRPGDIEEVRQTFPSVADVRAWADFNNYVLGVPQAHVATFAIEHRDGSPLSQEVLANVQKESSEALYEARQREAINAINKVTGFCGGYVFNLYEGAAQVAMARSGHFSTC